MLARRRSTKSRSRVGWYVRIGLYGVFLVGTFWALNGLRGKIPQAFGLTPVRVDALSVSRIPSGADATGAEQDYSVTVRIIGRKTPPAPLHLDQFELHSADGGPYRPFASDIVFAEAGTLRVDEGDTVTGVMVFTLPAGDEPRELWWQP